MEKITIEKIAKDVEEICNDEGVTLGDLLSFFDCKSVYDYIFTSISEKLYDDIEELLIYLKAVRKA